MRETDVTRTFGALIDEGYLFVSDGYRAKNEELGGEGAIFLRSAHLTDNGIDLEGVERFHVGLLERVRSKLSATDDVIVTTKGNSTGRVGYVTADLPQFVYSPHLSFWRSLDTGVVVPGFLRYWSMSREFRDQLSGLKASTDMAPYLSLVDQRRLRITLPPPAEQRAIAATLGALDDKIELDRQMNETLEAMAGAIFKSWFVDFDPVRAKAERCQPAGMDAETAALFPGSFEATNGEPIPRGWKRATIADLALVIDCLHSKKPDRCESGKPLLQLWNIRDDGLLDMSDPYWISEGDYTLWSSRIEATQGDCVVTNVGRVGAVAQIPVGMNAALGRNMTAVRCRPDYPFPTFLLEALLSDAMREEIESKTDSGTILDSLNVRNIPRLQVTLAPSAVLDRFERLARPLRTAMEANHAQSRTLATLRDTLLPKLMSGAVRVQPVGTMPINV